VCCEAINFDVFAGCIWERYNHPAIEKVSHLHIHEKRTQAMSSQTVASISASKPLANPVLGVSTTIGVAGVLLMGVVSWMMLLVNRELAVGVVIAVSLAAYAGLVFLFLRNVASRQSFVGAIAGVIGGAVSLIFIGSLMTERVKVLESVQSHSSMEILGVQMDRTVVSGTVVYQPGGFTGSGIALGVGVIVGMIFLGWLAGRLRARNVSYVVKDVDWRARFAWVVALSYLPLIAVGGLVTSTESGLAVPDSVRTYGSVGILFPLSLMEDPRIYLEHSHRIFGTFAGLATILLVVRMFGAPSRLMPRVMSAALLFGVVGQGLMGIFRVSEQSQGLAMLHGVLAQIVFALAIATGVVCSKRWEGITPSDDAIAYAKSTRLMLMIATVGLGIQLVFGAMARHLDSGHAVMSHVGLSFIVVMLVIIAGAKCIRIGKIDREVKGGAGAIRPYGAMVHGFVMLQFTLGWGALAMTRTGGQGHPELPTSTELAGAPGIRVGEAIMTTSHHLIGALLLAMVVGALAWSMRIASRPKNG